MSKLTQRDYWNSRAEVWGNYDVPLIPDAEEVDFHRKFMVLGGKRLVLGATRELCAMARAEPGETTAVDFAQDVIEALRLPGVDYVCEDWFAYLRRSTEQFDNIMTDGGLVCLEYPETWKEMAELIYAHLKPGGVFSARVYVSTAGPPQSYANPMLSRFINGIGAATAESHWMMRPSHPDYEPFDVRYAFPPAVEVQRIFGRFALQATLTPDYPAGQHFLSLAWQRPVD